MKTVRLPLIASLAGHAVGLALLVWASLQLAPLVQHRLVPNPVSVVFEAPPAPAPPAPAASPAPPPPPAEVTAPPPPPPVPEVKPPPPSPMPVPEMKAPPRVRPKVELRRAPEPRIRPPPHPMRVEPEPLRQPPPRPAPPQTAALPPPRPPAAPTVSAAYRGALARWFASHNRYPESARARGEQGEAVLRFRVDRAGRVLSFSLARSTGYPDLDAAVEAMLRGAALPPFPSDMAAAEVEVSVPVRFSLSR